MRDTDQDTGYVDLDRERRRRRRGALDELGRRARAHAAMFVQLAAAARALVEVDREILRAAFDHPVPPIYESGVRYWLRHDDEWCDLRVVLEQGHGDVVDLAAWRAAELLEAGVEARVRFVQKFIGRMDLRGGGCGFGGGFLVVAEVLAGGRVERPYEVLR